MTIFVPLRAAIGLMVAAALGTPALAGRSATDERDKQSATTHLLKVARSIELPAVRGGFDLMAADVAGRRLFVDAEDQGTTEVLDLNGAGRLLRSITGMRQPKWAVYRWELSKLFVATGDGTVQVFDTRTYARRASIAMPLPANNLRFDEATGLLLVGMGDTAGAIGVIDPLHDRLVRTAKLRANPKQFEIDGHLLYANIPSLRTVQIVDWTTGAEVGSWPACGSRNVPMAIDRAGRRLFIGCEEGLLEVHDLTSGRTIASLPIGRLSDGVWFDRGRERVYVSSGEGFVDVVGLTGRSGLRSVRRVLTREGAGTSLLSLPLHRLFVALPQRDGESARIDSYDLDAF